jgi:hypothetical protein
MPWIILSGTPSRASVAAAPERIEWPPTSGPSVERRRDVNQDDVGVKIGDSHLTKIKQSGEACKEHGEEKKVIVGAGLVSMDERGDVIKRKGSLLEGNREAMELLHDGKGSRDKSRIASGADVWEMMFKRVAYARKVGGNRRWFNMMRHENDKEA